MTWKIVELAEASVLYIYRLLLLLLLLLLLSLLESQFLDSLLCFGKDETVMNMKINCSTSILYILSFFGMMHPNMKYTLYKLLFFISTSKIEVVMGKKKKKPTIDKTF